MIRIHRIPFSTNVERTAIAAAHKGLEVDWVDHDAADRGAIRALSGQDLVPVAEIDGEVVADSMAILQRLETLAPDPPLWPRDPQLRRQVDGFVTWFNQTWKVPPNAIAAELATPDPDPARIAAWQAQMRATVPYFDSLLHGGDFLFGDRLSVADVCAFPFLKYAAGIDPGDPDPFHRILNEHLPLEDADRLAAWLRRCDALPRA